LRIAIATYERPSAPDADYDFLAPALRRGGAEVAAPAWSEAAIGWEDFDLVMVSSTWDHSRRVEEFREWLATVERVTMLQNPRRTIEWNLDKRYLRELESAGVPTIPTVWTEPGGEDEIEAAVAELGWADIVLKPTVDAGAQRLARVETAMVGRILRSLDEPGMAQPFQRSVERQGELSLVFVEGEPTHALRRRPAPGDFRVQGEYGGSQEPVEASGQALEIGREALRLAPGEPLYARVDLLADERGSLRLIELELIDPSLYLSAERAGSATLARALLAAARGSAIARR
jgi:glutathione synthase/RimK-type ligase-like ATP-grasp enzyme